MIILCVVCDTCRKPFHGHFLPDNQGFALSYVQASGWTHEGARHFCKVCSTRDCLASAQERRSAQPATPATHPSHPVL